ncbi:uncharacterized protein [Ptychodera flava]|uniref:uncharacterized protein isoform X2 n=1 Tax=Ptychodera flava TaxID=63121 RepID=UPI003969D50C
MIEHNGITYHVYADEVTWREAYSLCKAELSVLAKISDQETQDVITTHLNNDEVLATGSFWIDAKDDNEEGVWVDSESNELTYTAWAPDEPNNGGLGQHTEDCAHLWWEHDFKWNDNWCKSHIYFICQTGMASECYTTEDGHDYLGSVSTTETGLECQYWSEQSPHAHTSHKPYPSLKGHNYCRNPDGSGDKPWCYTTDPDTRWEYCAVGNSQWMCDEDDIECFERYDGRDYMGHISVTETGKTCQSWNVQTPHRHSYRGDDYLGEHNYCRNPNYSSRPWCYTMDPDILWQYCDVCGNGQTFTGDNIALNKRAWQTSVMSGGTASKAVDGFASTFWGDGSCTHTNIEVDPWWEVDLEYTYFVTEIVITNRRDCCSERLEGAVVRVGSSMDITSNSQCGEAVSPYTAEESATISFKCASDTVGRYVSVQLEGKNQYLTLCEVEVHGSRATLWRPDQRCGPRYPTISNINGECDPKGGFPCCSPFGWCGISNDHCNCFNCIDYREVYKKNDSKEEEQSGETNLALLKEATQSSLFEIGVPSNAVDGRKNSAWVDKSCTHTLEDDDAWWKVDLGDVYPIDRVVITNRGECCQDRLQGAVVRVGIEENIKRNSKCGDTLSVDDVNDRPIIFKCNGVSGHVVSVQLEGRRDYLTLCEVEVYKSEGESWREDVQCGPGFTAPNGVSPAECDPHGIYPCCSTANWCGISNDHCKCYGCIDYREVYGVTESPVDACSEPKRITIPDDGEVTVTSPTYPNFYPSYANCRWFITADSDMEIEVTVNEVDLETCCANVYIGTGDTLRQNELFTVTNTMTTSTVAESNKVWIQFVSSASQVQRGEGFSITLKPKSRGNAWREDVQCGPGFTAPNGVSPAECDPHGIYPCCSTANWCGISDDHCKCYGCIDYREVYGVTESPVDACSEPKRITIPRNGEVTVTSPNYPIFYPSYANCRWYVTAESDSEIQINVNDVDLESCCANVYIGTGDDVNYNQLLSLSSGTTTSSVAESNKVWIRFASSATRIENGHGFSITLKAQSGGNAWREDVQCGPGFTAPNGVSPAECDPHGIYPCCSTANWCGISDDHCKCVGCIDYREVYGVTDESPVDACTDTKRITIPSSGEVTVTSPAYPDTYPNYANCRWIVSTTNPNHQIEITVDDVNIESCCDHATVGSGDSFDDNVLLTIRDTDVDSVTSPSSTVWVHFTTDATYTYRGFQLTLREKITGPSTTVIEATNACESVQNIELADGDTVLVNSPNYPDVYPDDASCKWLISTVNPSSKLKVEFSTFNTERCCDELQIGTGEVFGENVIVIGKGSELPTITPDTDTGSKLWAKFVSDGSQADWGFQFQVTTIAEGEKAPSCASRWSEKSGSGNDVQVEIECEEGEVMTSCNSVTNGSESHGTRDGERIVQVTSKPKCVAQNGEGGLGVYAVARCCKWSGLQCIYTESVWKSGTGDDDVAEAMCDTSVNDLPASTLGCMAHTYSQWLDGARPWTVSDDFLTNSQMDFVRNGCVAQNGIYGNGVLSEASCCSAPGLQCQHIYSHRSDGTSGAVAHVQCEEGWVMTGCSVFTYWGVTDGAYVTDDGMCKAINGGEASMGNNTRGVWAVAVCCKSSDQLQ